MYGDSQLTSSCVVVQLNAKRTISNKVSPECDGQNKWEGLEFACRAMVRSRGVKKNWEILYLGLTFLG